MKYGFIGLGAMGLPMARHLAANYPVLAYDRDSAKKDAVFGTRITWADALAAFSDVDALLLSLPDGKVVDAALFHPDTGVVQYLKPGTLVIDTSTIEYQATLDIAARLSDAGLRFLDAPVSGMPKRAQDGSLTMMVGGAKADFDVIRHDLAAVASKILHMGDVGSGQLTKLVNQLLYDINLAALAEILPMAVKLGLDPDKTAAVVNSGTGRSQASEFFLPHILNGSFDNGYTMAAAYKDLVSGAEISARNGIPTPVLSAATGTYQQALLQGLGGKDKGAMIQVFETLLGVAFRSKSENGTS